MSMTGKLHPADAEAGDVVETGAWYDHGTDSGGHTTSRGRVFGVLPIRYDDCDRYGCNKVVVVDPEDREQVERLVEELCEGQWGHRWGKEQVDKMQAALREFANPTPPIEEPTGLGAVVEDDGGDIYVRTSSIKKRPWVRVLTGNHVGWSEMDDTPLQVLSEGVPAEADQ